MKNFLRENIRLSLFFFLLLFLSGRIGLLLHEFAGHALIWRFLGGELTEFKLFMFGGGRVHYGWTSATQNLSVFSTAILQLSGIVVELIAGCLFAVLAILSAASRAAKALFSAASSLLIVHALFYLLICTYYGYGDGEFLFDTFKGNYRHGFLFLSFCLTVGAAFFVSYAFSPFTRSWVVDFANKKRDVLIVFAAMAAVLLHGALAVGEQIVVKDHVYAEIKTSKNVRLMEKEFREFIAAYTEKHGRGPDPKEAAVVADKLKQKYRQFPIEIPLGLAVLIALMAGFFFSGTKEYDGPNSVRWKDNYVLGSVSALTALIIMVLNRI